MAYRKAYTRVALLSAAGGNWIPDNGDICSWTELQPHQSHFETSPKRGFQPPGMGIQYQAKDCHWKNPPQHRSPASLGTAFETHDGHKPLLESPKMKCSPCQPKLLKVGELGEALLGPTHPRLRGHPTQMVARIIHANANHTKMESLKPRTCIVKLTCPKHAGKAKQMISLTVSRQITHTNSSSWIHPSGIWTIESSAFQ